MQHQFMKHELLLCIISLSLQLLITVWLLVVVYNMQWFWLLLVL